MYTEEVIDHFLYPRNVGELQDADGVGEVVDAAAGSVCVFHIKLKNGRISKTGYRVGGCPNTIAACSVASELVLGLTPEEANLIQARDVERVLHWKPDEYMFSTKVVLQALRNAAQAAELERKKHEKW